MIIRCMVVSLRALLPTLGSTLRLSLSLEVNRIMIPIKQRTIELEPLLLPSIGDQEDEQSPHPRSPFAETHFSTADAEIGLQAQNNSEIWNTYNIEATKADIAMLDASNRSIDVLLVFTGLFSAVLTSFIIQAYQLLIPGPSDATNALLSQMIELQMRALNDTAAPLGIVTLSPTDSAPSSSQLHWVNGLWFIALAFSLSAALFGMLGKQWLQSNSNVSGSSHHRARQRQQKYLQMKKWHVMAIIDALPLLLHATLLLFFAGLIVLLSSANPPITIATSIIVAVVYACYFGSVWLSLVYPDCPYVHPISGQLRNWRKRKVSAIGDTSSRTSKRPPDSNPWTAEPEPAIIPNHIDEDDRLDAFALIWLFEECPNEVIRPAALQAIGDFPRRFTAFHILRDAGAIHLVLKGFEGAFHKDSTLDSQWYVSRPRDAERYCRAWMRLTHNTQHRWPEHLMEHLKILGNLEHTPDIGAIAACTRTLAQADFRDGRVTVLSYLTRHSQGNIELNNDLQCWLLDTFLRCSVLTVIHARPKDHLVVEAVPTFLRLLLCTTRTIDANIRTAIVLCLSYMTGTSMNTTLLDDSGTKRDGDFYNLLIPSLAKIINDPSRYGVDNGLLDTTATEFSRLTSRALTPLVDGVHREKLTSLARQALFKVYLEGRIKRVSDHTLSDVLQILYPPTIVTEQQQPLFVKSLIYTLQSCAQPIVLISPILRLLEPLFTNASPALITAFVENDGIAAVIRAAREGETENRRLQLDCIKSLCLFIQCVAQAALSERDIKTLPVPLDSHGQTKIHLDHIFRSDFFPVLTTTIASHAWWLPEIADVWTPALLKLCLARPDEPVWLVIEVALRKFASFHDGKDGHYILTEDLDFMKDVINSTRNHPNGGPIVCP